MGILFSEEADHVESLVFFLSDALRVAVEVGDQLQHSPCEMPRIAPDMECSEIAHTLAGFRDHMNELWDRELLMLTKILRARELAKELRIYAPELKPEIDTFRLATVMTPDMRDALMPAMESIFNGKVQPKSFLEARGFSETGAGTRAEPVLGYRIAGQLDVRLLIDACEALHFRLAARFGGEAPVLLLQEECVQQVSARAAEEPFLLSDLAEILSEGETPVHSPRNASAEQQPVVH